MADDTEKPSLVKIAELLDSFGVEFVVIGGQAAAIHGSAIPTYDVDLCYRRSEANLTKLAAALEILRPQLRGAPPNLPFVIDARSLALGTNFTFDTTLGPLDLLGWIEPLGGYDDVINRCETVKVGAANLHVLSLQDLISIKRHLGRPKDLAMLSQLEEIERLRESDP